jgi:hypothetical protein
MKSQSKAKYAIAKQYALDVVSGAIPAVFFVKQAAERFLKEEALLGRKRKKVENAMMRADRGERRD